MTRADGPGAADQQRRSVAICAVGVRSVREIERTLRQGDFEVSRVSEAELNDLGRSSDGPTVVVLSDEVVQWLRLVRKLSRARTRPRMLLVSDLSTRVDVVTALSAGVDGVVRPADGPIAVAASVVALCNEGVSLPRALTKDLVREVRAGRDRSVQSSRGPVRMTDREWQILQLLLQGMTTREMATELFVAEGTIRSHVSALLGKLGVRSRREAVMLVGGR